MGHKERFVAGEVVMKVACDDGSTEQDSKVSDFPIFLLVRSGPLWTLDRH